MLCRLHFCDAATQRKWFSAQFALAAATRLPMFLHLRAAAADFLTIWQVRHFPFPWVGHVLWLWWAPHGVPFLAGCQEVCHLPSSYTTWPSQKWPLLAQGPGGTCEPATCMVCMQEHQAECPVSGVVHSFDGTR